MCVLACTPLQPLYVLLAPSYPGTRIKFSIVRVATYFLMCTPHVLPKCGNKWHETWKFFMNIVFFFTKRRDKLNCFTWPLSDVSSANSEYGVAYFTSARYFTTPLWIYMASTLIIVFYACQLMYEALRAATAPKPVIVIVSIISAEAIAVAMTTRTRSWPSQNSFIYDFSSASGKRICQDQHRKTFFP